MSYIPLYSTKFADGANLDAFSRLRVSQNNILLDLKQLYDNAPLLCVSSASVGATASFSYNRASTEMCPGTASGNIVIRQTKEYFKYTAGNSQLIFQTFTSAHAEANVRKRVGYFDANNGLFLETSGSDVSFVIRSSVSGAPVDIKVSQSAWNLDKLDGTGASGETLNLSASQILITDFQWLGVGRVRHGFDISGSIIYAHELSHANINSSVYIRTPQLPVRYEIENLATVAATPTLEQICSTVIREGGERDKGILECFDSFNISTATTTPRTALIIALRSDFIRSSFIPLYAGINNRGSGTVRYRVILNPTLTGGTPVYANSGSMMKVSVSQLNYTANTGHVIAAGFASSTNQNKTPSDSLLHSNLKVVSNIAGVSDVLAVVVDCITSTNAIDVVIQGLSEK